MPDPESAKLEKWCKTQATTWSGSRLPNETIASGVAWAARWIETFLRVVPTREQAAFRLMIYHPSAPIDQVLAALV